MMMGRCLCCLCLLHLHLCVCNECERTDGGLVVTASGVTAALVERSAFSVSSRTRERRNYAFPVEYGEGPNPNARVASYEPRKPGPDISTLLTRRKGYMRYILGYITDIVQNDVLSATKGKGKTTPSRLGRKCRIP